MNGPPDIDEILRQELTEEQRAAATDESADILVIACAGSGKSRTLAYRIAWLISRGADAASIVAFTFTEKAADSIQQRVATALARTGRPSTEVGKVRIGTIHAFCREMLVRIDARYRQFDVLDQNGLHLFLISRYPELGIQQFRDRAAGYSPGLPHWLTPGRTCTTRGWPWRMSRRTTRISVRPCRGSTTCWTGPTTSTTRR